MFRPPCYRVVALLSVDLPWLCLSPVGIAELTGTTPTPYCSSRRPLTKYLKYGSRINFLFSVKDEDTLRAFLKYGKFVGLSVLRGKLVFLFLISSRIFYVLSLSIGFVVIIVAFDIVKRKIDLSIRSI